MIEEKILQNLLKICFDENKEINETKTKLVIDHLLKTKPSLLKPFRNYFRKYMVENTVEVTSSYQLSQPEKSAIEQRFQTSFFQYNVNKDILGGLIVKIGDVIIDNSILSKINQIK